MMKPMGRRQRSRTIRFVLPQIVPMKPYVTRLVADLRRVSEQRNRLELSSPRVDARSHYEDRRRLYEHQEAIGRLAGEERTIRAELRQIGCRIGNLAEGEILFGCLVDNRDAFFIWYVDRERPTHWRFRNDGRRRPIPERWFSLFAMDRRRRAVDPA